MHVGLYHDAGGGLCMMQGAMHDAHHHAALPSPHYHHCTVIIALQSLRYHNCTAITALPSLHMGTYDTHVCGHRTLMRPAGKYSMTYVSLVLLHWLALSHPYFMVQPQLRAAPQ